MQQKCFDELFDVFGADTKEPTTISKLNQLFYLEITIKESLRLFPSVPFIGRIAMEDIELSEILVHFTMFTLLSIDSKWIAIKSFFFQIFNAIF